VLADDHDQFLDEFEALLASEGVWVLGKERTGVGVLQLLEEQPITAVVVDLQLPDMNGLEVAPRVAEVARDRPGYGSLRPNKRELDIGVESRPEHPARIVLHSAPCRRIVRKLVQAIGHVPPHRRIAYQVGRQLV